MPLYNVEAIVLRSRAMGEADKLVTLFARGHGKIQSVAKGARRTSSKFGGSLELFTYAQLLLASAKTFDIISQCEIIESFRHIRESQEKLKAGYYIVKIIDIMIEDRQVNDELFLLMLSVLREIEKSGKPEAVISSFEVRLCETEGILPSKEMLERIYKRLPLVVSVLRVGPDNEGKLTDKDIYVAGKYFKTLLSDHTGYDISKIKAVL